MLTHAVLLLAGLVAARAALLGVLDLAARLAAATGRRVATIAAALRPRLARRLLATVVGLGVPAAAAVAPSTPASAAATRPEADTGAGRAGRAVVVPAPLPAGRAEIYVVRPGDTLWDIARRHLPASSAAADLARSWPRWYSANRAAIGPDPSPLRPGMRLRSPEPRPAGTPARAHARPSATPADRGAVARSLDPDRR
ncbi:MAG TPA: LysM domain-containing protein [Candidatus Nanopelagicales bacterium]